MATPHVAGVITLIFKCKEIPKCVRLSQ
ncbi:hypothetical protein [Nostoc sp.]